MRNVTGKDLGLDIAAWHKSLMNSAEHREQYMCPYTWGDVRCNIEELCSDN